MISLIKMIFYLAVMLIIVYIFCTVTLDGKPLCQHVRQTFNPETVSQKPKEIKEGIQEHLKEKYIFIKDKTKEYSDTLKTKGIKKIQKLKKDAKQIVLKVKEKSGQTIEEIGENHPDIMDEDRKALEKLIQQHTK